MTTWKMTLGWGAVLLLATTAAAHDADAQQRDRAAEISRARFRTLQSRFGDAGRHPSGYVSGRWVTASWRGHQRHQGRGQMGKHRGFGPRAFASVHGRHRHGAVHRYAMARRHGHGQVGRPFGRQRMAWRRSYGYHGRHMWVRYHRGPYGRYAAWGRAGRGQRGHFVYRGHQRWHHGAMGRNFGPARMAAMRWRQRGFGPAQFARQGHGSRGYAMGPWMMRPRSQGYGGHAQARGPQFGARPPMHAGGQPFHHSWRPSARPASMPKREAQSRSSSGGATKAQLSNRLERLQRELDRLRREAR